MEKFEQWLNKYCADKEMRLMAEGFDAKDMAQTWQEATKQRDAQYELMAEHAELSIREDAVVGECQRIVRDLRAYSKGSITDSPIIMREKIHARKLADHIEKDSN